MRPEDFLQAYERALATQDWERVAPLVHPDACVTFSNGARHEGREAVGAAFRANFAAIQGEEYAVSNVRWVRQAERLAVCLFDFAWRGVIDGREAAGAGRGTHVLVRDADEWQLLVEHLGPKAP